MKIYSNNIADGYLDDRFGHRDESFDREGPNRSFHVGWGELPANTQSLALLFIDHDAIPVAGFSWIHWTAANIDPALGELPENASLDMNLLQGLTSRASRLLPEGMRLDIDAASGFGGCAPPDKDHQYTLYLYALDTRLDLERGFYANEMFKAMEGHILDKAKLQMIYRAR
ncbi:MAG: YbhB/YbcL family Raf kinase inhibitor-like protein [Gammaproteobacteria bacterium]|nr:YbhB/YbcL family Raf kinase inhibitor-like protein [Gammaproteobacteria bacterium]